jgi:hypothetical protein
MHTFWSIKRWLLRRWWALRKAQCDTFCKVCCILSLLQEATTLSPVVVFAMVGHAMFNSVSTAAFQLLVGIASVDSLDCLLPDDVSNRNPPGHGLRCPSGPSIYPPSREEARRPSVSLGGIVDGWEVLENMNCIRHQICLSHRR